MGRPRKDYGTEQARIDHLKKMNRDRVNQHRMIQRQKAKEAAELSRRINSNEGVFLPTPEELANRPPEKPVRRRTRIDSDPNVISLATD